MEPAPVCCGSLIRNSYPSRLIGRSMKTKVKYVLPAFAAVFALMFVAATPYVIAEPGQEK